MEKPYFILPQNFSESAGKRLIGVGQKIAALFPGLQYDLKKLDEKQGAGEYIAEAMLNAFALAAIVFLALFAAQALRGGFSPAQLLSQPPEESAPAMQALAQSALQSALFFIAALAFFAYGPRMQALKKGETIDKDLIFAFKDMMLQLSSGVSLYGALNNVARAKYGAVSAEFAIAVKDISAGETEARALEKMAFRAESEYLRQATFQLATALRSGTPVDAALKSSTLSLLQNQKTQIKNYAAELNLLVLAYLILAVALPGLGTTVLVILSAFGTITVTESFMAATIMLSALMQAAIIQVIKIRRPPIHL